MWETEKPRKPVQEGGRGVCLKVVEHRQTGTHTHGQIDTDIHIHRQTHTYTQTDRHTDTHTDRETDRQTHTHTHTHTHHVHMRNITGETLSHTS